MKEVPPKNPEPTETTRAPTDAVTPTKQPQGPTTKFLPTESTIKSNTTKPLGTSPATPTQPRPSSTPQSPTTTVNPKLAGRVTKEQYNNFEHDQQTNPYFPDFPSANPDSFPPPPSHPPTNGRVGDGPYLTDTPMRPPPPPRQQYYPSRSHSRPYDDPPRRPFQMEGYGFNGPPRAPSSPPRDRPSYEGPPERYRPPPPLPSRDSYHPRDRWNDHADRGNRNEEHSHKTLVGNHEGRGNAGDLGDFPSDHLKIQQTSNAIPDTLYGRRDKRPKANNVAQNETVENPVTRSVSWAFHEDVMNKEHAFNEQYKDFETMDEAINQKHRKKQAFKSPSKPVQVKANVRSWKFNRNETINKMAKEQYDDFEKTNVQIAQDMASKHYNEQYEGFEAFKSATANQNGNETKEETEQANKNEKLTNEQPIDNPIPMNPSEATKSDATEQPVDPSPNPTTIITKQNNSTSSNTSVLSNQENSKPIETDEYKQYMNAIDNSPVDAFPNFPNATSSKSTLLNDTNFLLNQPIEPSLSNVSYGISSTNSSTLNSTATVVPVRTLSINSSEPVSVKNTTSPLVNTTDPIKFNFSSLPVNITSSPQVASTNSTQNTTTTTPASKAEIRKEPELSMDTMAMKRTSTSYPDDLIKNLLLLKDRLSEEANEHKSLEESKDPAAERREGPYHHQKLQQISGPPNYFIQKRISSSSNPRTGMQRTMVMDLPAKSKHLALKNLTGMVKLNDDVNDGRSVEKIEKEQSEISSSSATSPIVEMVKSGVISLEEKDSKDFFQYLVSALKNKSVESLPPITRTQKKDHKLRTMPNPYDFVVPETKKFILEGAELDEERLMEILGEHAITTRQKQRQLEQRRRVSQIKNQALSKRIPLMGHFSTSQLKEFKLQSQDEDEDETTSFLKTLEPIVKMMTKNGSSILDSFDAKNADKKKNSIKNALRSFIRRNKMFLHHPSIHQKRQNLKNINQPLYTVQQNMADMIKIWQNTMDDVPGLTDENRKIDESGGTANETIEKIKEDQKGIKEKVKENVDNEVEEQKQKTQKVVQDNNPASRRDGGGVGEDHVHKVFAKVKAGTDKLREKLKHKLYEKMIDYHHMHDDNFDFKGNVPRLPNNQEEIKNMLNQELESVISGQNNISRKLDRVFEKAISQFPKNKGTKKDLVTATQDKIQEDAKKVGKKVDEVIQKAQQDHLDTLNRVLQPPAQGQFVEHINAESLPGLDKRSNITLPNNKRHFHFEQKSKKTLQALKNYLHLSWKHGAGGHSKINTTNKIQNKINTTNTDFKNALANLFFDDEKKSNDLLKGIFPEVLKSDRKELRHQHRIDGKILGSRARNFRKAILQGRKKKNQTTKTTAGMKRITKRESRTTTFTLRGLIPSAIGDMSPSSEHPTTTTKPSIENAKEKIKATASTNENTLAQPWDQHSLNALIKLQKDYNNLKTKLLQQQIKNKTGGGSTEKEETKEMSTGSVGTSPEDENIPPVGEDGKPHPNSGPQEDHRTDEEKQGDPEKENNNHQDGESGKDEVGSHLISKVRNDKTKDPKNDNSFEAGLTDGEKNVETPSDKTKQDSSKANDKIKQDDGQLATQKLDDGQLATQKLDNSPPEDTKSPLRMTSDEPSKQNMGPPVNVTALELGIIKLLNESDPVQHAKTKHGKQMEELNKKYEALKLPIENGEFWPTQISKSKKKLKNDQKDKEKAGSNDNDPDENMPKVIDATPTESSPTADYLMQRLKLMELSSLLLANNKNNNNKTTTASQQPIPAELKLEDDLSTTNASPDGPEEMTIQLPSQPLQTTPQTPSLTNKSDGRLEISQTPAELAKKLAEQLHINNNNNNNNNVNDEKAPLQSEQIKTVATTTPQPTPITTPQPTPTTTPDTKQAAQPPVIPVPMDSKLGKMLYPNSDDRVTHNSTTSLIFDGTKESINTNIDGTNYSSVLVDKTKQLLEKNMINRKDLIDLLQSAHVLDNLHNLIPSNEQKNDLIESLNTQPGSRSTVTKNGKTHTKDIGEESIHITLQKKNGQFYLIPNHNEAYQKHLVPQEIGLVPYKKTRRLL